MENNRILVVDDDRTIRRILSDILKGGGYEPVAAATGVEAAAALQGEGADSAVALIDLRLEDMSGLEVMKQIKEISPDTECIILTGHASQETAIEAVNLGAYSYVQKSYEMESLLLTIRRACDKRNAERALRESEEKYRQLVESISDIVYATNRNGIIEYISPSVEPLTGYGTAEMIGRPFVEFIYEEDIPFIRNQIHKIISGHMGSSEYRILIKTGEIRWIRTSSRPVFEEGAFAGLRGVMTDITERKKMEEALEKSNKEYRELSLTDGLTKLYNSRHFCRQLESEIERANRYHHPLTLLMLDVDNFKNHNDSFGHLEGNSVLVQLAEVIRTSLRSSDSAYRYGGEEFMVILPETRGSEGMVVAERIREGFKDTPFHPAGGDAVHLTVSIGLAEYIHDGKPTELIERTDANMYRAKKGGKDRVFFTAGSDGREREDAQRPFYLS